MREKVLAIINEIRATKELPAVSSLNVNDSPPPRNGRRGGNGATGF